MAVEVDGAIAETRLVKVKVVNSRCWQLERRIIQIIQPLDKIEDLFQSIHSQSNSGRPQAPFHTDGTQMKTTLLLDCRITGYSGMHG